LFKQPIIRTICLNTNIGYGKGILAGLESAQGEVLAWTHADLQTDPKDVLEGFKLFSQTRNLQKSYIKGLRYGRSIPDFFFAVCMSCFETLLFRKLLWDINAQPNVFSREFYDTWVDPPHDFSLDLYVYFQAKRQRLNIIRFPVFFGLREHGVSHWNISWKDKMKFIYRTFRYSLKLKRES
jgi:glycosyltransferase involved in cell wall biosynthesis